MSHNGIDADGSPVMAHTQPTRYFRVQGDWEGGGFGYTLPFTSAEEAWVWGQGKAGFHRDAVITVIERNDDEKRLAGLCDGGAAAGHLKVESPTEYAQRRARENDRRALDAQLNGSGVR